MDYSTNGYGVADEYEQKFEDLRRHEVDKDNLTQVKTYLPFTNE